MQGTLVFDLLVNTREVRISHNKTSARNRSRRYGFASGDLKSPQDCVPFECRF